MIKQSAEQVVPRSVYINNASQSSAAWAAEDMKSYFAVA